MVLLAHQTNVIGQVSNVTWDLFCDQLKKSMNEAAFASWIAPCVGNIENNQVNIIAPNRFVSDFILHTHLSIINKVAGSFGLTVTVSIRRSVSCEIITENVNDNIQKAIFETSAPIANRDQTFNNFVTVDENSFAVAACKKVASSNAAVFSPLFIYGDEGCGKTHLLNAIAGDIESNGKRNVLMMTGAGFASDFIRSIHEKSTFDFKDKLRACDVLIIDGISALIGKRASTEEMLLTLLDLIAAGKQVVITAPMAPSALTGFDRRFQSILASGLVVDVCSMNAHVKKTILARAGLDLNVAEHIASIIQGNGHVMSGVLKKVAAWSDLTGQKVSRDRAEFLLRDVISQPKTPTDFVKKMCESIGVAFDDVLSSRRQKSVVRARYMMMYVLKNSTDLSLTAIGKLLGDRDHATVLYGIDQIEQQKLSDLTLIAELDQLARICGGSI